MGCQSKNDDGCWCSECSGVSVRYKGRISSHVRRFARPSLCLDYLADIVAKYGAEKAAALASNGAPKLYASYRKTFDYVGTMVAQHGIRSGLKKFAKAAPAPKKEIGSSAQPTTQSLPVDQHAKVNQAPYDPRNAQGLASELLGSADFTRTTVPGYNMPNVRLAGRCKERTIVVNPETQETLGQRVVFDQRRFPIFDPYVKVETRISGDLTHMRSEQHMKLATQQLKRNILSGQLDGHSFTTKQLNAIMKEYERIPGFVWHHHQEIGRMQLVPRDIHDWIKHVGGNSAQMWGTGR